MKTNILLPNVQITLPNPGNMYFKGDQVVLLYLGITQDLRYLRIWDIEKGNYLLWCDSRNGIIGAMNIHDAEYHLRPATDTEKVLYYGRDHFGIYNIEVTISVTEDK